MTPIALVTGANRGIGREVARQLAVQSHVVYLGSRDTQAGEKAADELRSDGLDVRAITIDVTDLAGLSDAAARIGERHSHLDVLVNNAAIHYDTWQLAADADLTIVRQAFETNVFGAWQTTQAVLPLLRGGRHGRIVNVSSGAGSLTDMGGSTPAYRMTKASLNALTRMCAAELSRARILVNSVCPGWVQTEMGGPGGRPVAEGAAGIVWAATLPDNGPNGGFFRDRHPIPW
jgi:NAD(P)-dependent dehydrogenase (short-subunit alcohol dehydrogenase family)